jgi:glycosyltransferase involved in cell wall biosynthesis
MTLVSIVIPTFNYGRFLREAVDSVLAQGVTDLEIIIVDDGSTDDTPAVVTGIRDPRVRAVRTPNGGIASARNTGLALAQGTWLAFLDADDRWVSTKLERQLAMVEHEPDLDLVFTDFVRFDETRRFEQTQFEFVRGFPDVPTRPARAGGGRILLGDPFALLAPLGGFATWVQTVMLRRERVADLRFPPRHISSEDFHYMLRAYRRARVAGFIAEPLVEVRRHGDNSYESEEDKLEPDVIALTDLLREPLTPAHHAILLRRIGRAWSSLGYYHYWRGRAGTSVRAWANCLRYPGRRTLALRYLAALPLRPVVRAVRKTSFTGP